MKRFPTIILISAAIAAAALTVSCGGRGSGKNQQDSSSADVAQAQIATVPDTIAPLVPGEVHFKNDAEAFGEELQLKGDTVLREEIFKVGVSTMILKDSLMLVCCEDDRPFRMYSLPDLELKGISGNRGRGPMEFISPDIWPYEGSGYIAMINENFRDIQGLYKIRTDGVIEQIRHRIPSQYNASSYTRGLPQWMTTILSSRIVLRYTFTTEVIPLRRLGRQSGSWPMSAWANIPPAAP